MEKETEIPKIAHTSLFEDVVEVYAKRTSELLIYGIVFVLATSAALVLDLRFHVPPSMVLLYTVGLTILLTFGVPLAYVVFKENRFALTQQIAEVPVGKYSLLYHNKLAMPEREELTISPEIAEILIEASWLNQSDSVHDVRQEIAKILSQHTANRVLFYTARTLLQSLSQLHQEQLGAKPEVFVEGYDEGYQQAVRAYYHALASLTARWEAEQKAQSSVYEWSEETSEFRRALEEIKRKVQEDLNAAQHPGTSVR